MTAHIVVSITTAPLRICSPTVWDVVQNKQPRTWKWDSW